MTVHVLTVVIYNPMYRTGEGGGMESLSAERIESRMSLREKIALMTPKSSIFQLIWQAVILRHYNKTPVRAGGNKRFGVPEIRFCDGPRGLVCHHATCFPVSIARAASFDPDLEERIGMAIAKEIRSVNGNYYGGVCVNVPYHPAWGRSQESYGEEPYVAGVFGAALVKGVQHHNVIACVKHFALNSMENVRLTVNIVCSERTLREVYLPHFKKCIDAGAGSVMGAYNKFRGEHCCHNRYLLRTILKDEWKFAGFTMSDFLWGISNTEKAVNAGTDVEMPLSRYYGRKLRRALRMKKIDQNHVDDAAKRIAATMLDAKRAVDPLSSYPRGLLACDEHVRLAAEAAERSMTLVKNEDQALPFIPEEIKRIAVFGRLAKKENLGDFGSSRVYPPYAVTPLQGIENLFDGRARIIYSDGNNPDECRRIAESADAAVIFVGYDESDEGEYISNAPGKVGGDRRNLSLHPEDIDLIKAVGPANPKSAVVLIGGGTILVAEWEDKVSAILFAFYPGMEGGNAIARTLMGVVNPGGKLPFVIPAKESDLQPFDAYADEVTYGYYHGYTMLDKNGVAPSYHYGHGLSYTRFDVSEARFVASSRGVTARCRVSNVGDRPGDEVIQFYVGFENSSVDRPVKLLRGFERATLSPGTSKTVEIFCSRGDLGWYNPETSKWEVENIVYRGYLGSSADPAKLAPGEFSF
jgi:beta-glucosidase